jgi:hypothetical protein
MKPQAGRIYQAGKGVADMEGIMRSLPGIEKRMSV